MKKTLDRQISNQIWHDLIKKGCCRNKISHSLTIQEISQKKFWYYKRQPAIFKQFPSEHTLTKK